MGGTARVKPRFPKKIYLAAWREFRALSQEALGAKLHPPVEGMTISRWERGEVRMSDQVMAAVAEPLDIEPQDLYRLPTTPSADAMLRDAPEELQQAALRAVAAIISKAE